VDHFRRGFAAELIKLSAKAPENLSPMAYDGENADGQAGKAKKGLGEAVVTKPARRDVTPGPLTSMSEAVGYTGAPRG
jgi:hypothetical protein